jgi:hypothetical protein
MYDRLREQHPGKTLIVSVVVLCGVASLAQQAPRGPDLTAPTYQSPESRHARGRRGNPRLARS